MITPEDRAAADKAYDSARTCAIAEYDTLFPEAKKLNDRLMTLRAIIRSTSAILSRPLAEEHEPGYEARLKLREKPRG